MTAPGSSHALVLATTTPVDIAATQLLAFLDDTEYTAVAVVHGRGKLAPRAFGTAKQRLTTGRGVVWIPDAEILDTLTALDAATLTLYKPVKGYLVSFVNVDQKKIVKKLKWFKVSMADIDEAYIATGLG